MTMEHRLPRQSYMRFPFMIGAAGAVDSDRAQHVHEQIEQVLLTIAGERVFRRDFGAGVRRLVFEPNAAAIHSITTGQLRASLEEALRGEVDPKTIAIKVGQDPEDGSRMLISITYVLGTTGDDAQLTLSVGGSGNG